MSGRPGKRKEAEMSGHNLFDGKFLRKLEQLSLLVRRLYLGQQRGERRAQRFGPGLEFADFRCYAPGDDVRHIDWNAYLRLDRLFLRLFEQDEDLSIFIFLDASRSMGFGHPSKLDFGKRLAAAFAYIGLANLDSANLMLYRGGLDQRTPVALRGKQQILTVFSLLSGLEASGNTRLDEAVRCFLRQRPRRGLAIIISDLFDPSWSPACRLLIEKQFSLFVFQVYAREEAAPEIAGELELFDSEDGSRLELSVSPLLLDEYRREFESYSNQIEGFCRRFGAGYLRAASDELFEELVLNTLRTRGWLE